MGWSKWAYRAAKYGHRYAKRYGLYGKAHRYAYRKSGKYRSATKKFTKYAGYGSDIAEAAYLINRYYNPRSRYGRSSRRRRYYGGRHYGK